MIITLENRRTVRTFFIAYTTPGTFFTIDQHGAVFRLLMDSVGRASTNTSRFLTMIAGDPLIMEADQR
jgi:hypothetical protein